MHIALNHQNTSQFTMSLAELEAALEAALHLSKSIYQRNGMDSKDYLRARRMVDEVTAEILARGSCQVRPT
jgi:hypothetical protein